MVVFSVFVISTAVTAPVAATEEVAEDISGSVLPPPRALSVVSSVAKELSRYLLTPIPDHILPQVLSFRLFMHKHIHHARKSSSSHSKEEDCTVDSSSGVLIAFAVDPGARQKHRNCLKGQTGNTTWRMEICIRR